MTQQAQAEALRLADYLSEYYLGSAAELSSVELRRLHYENESLQAVLAIQQAVPWVTAINDELVSTHVDVALPSDDYMTARRKLNNLICHEIEVAKQLEKERQETERPTKPWGACISGRIWIGKLPEHARKMAEAESLPIQWLYTEQQGQERKLPTDEQIDAAVLQQTGFDGDGYQSMTAEDLRRIVRTVHGIGASNAD